MNRGSNKHPNPNHMMTVKINARSAPYVAVPNTSIMPKLVLTKDIIDKELKQTEYFMTGGGNGKYFFPIWFLLAQSKMASWHFYVLDVFGVGGVGVLCLGLFCLPYFAIINDRITLLVHLTLKVSGGDYENVTSELDEIHSRNPQYHDFLNQFMRFLWWLEADKIQITDYLATDLFHIMAWW